MIDLENIERGFHGEPAFKSITKPQFELQLHPSL